MSTPFNRTTCSCPSCVACCKRGGGPLLLRDVQPICERAGLPPERLLWASPGTVLGRVGFGHIELKRVGTIVPQSTESGRCIFLTADECCAIHDIAPFGCAFYDTHMGQRDSTERTLWAVKDHERREYQELRATLPVRLGGVS